MAENHIKTILLDSPLEKNPKVSRKIVAPLKRLGINTVRDLLFHFPHRYDDFSNFKKIRELKAGETATVRGEIKKISGRRTLRKRLLLIEALIKDDTGIIKAVWFNQRFLTKNLKTGNTANFAGKVVSGAGGLRLQNPSYEKIFVRSPQKLNNFSIHTGGLVAVYPETKGITSRWLRYLIKNFIRLRWEIGDILPEAARRRHFLPEIKEAICAVHFPANAAAAERALKRFRFEKIFLLQLRALREKIKLSRHSAPVIAFNLPLMKEFVRSLPFALTDAQRRSMWEVFQDIAKPRPMNRLLEGDVGSGKTVVAAAASLLAAKSGSRALFMAPTEILARQHFETLAEILSPFGVKIGFLSGSEKRAGRGDDIVVGTHALIQKNAVFENLGLAIVDEQHRFGVSQRMALARGRKQKGKFSPDAVLLPHFLSMSATPIPRTLTLAVYGELDLSILDEMPKERMPIVTEIVEPAKRQKAYEFIRGEIKKGKQVFVVCPRIEAKNHSSGPAKFSAESGQQKLLLSEIKAVKEEYRKLKEGVFGDFSVDMLHGRMKSAEKAKAMKKFKEGATDVLVSTSVIEVGVDAPNANVMMIEGAENFGLAQLHQLRGRVGRGKERSYCFLFPGADGFAAERLRVLSESRNGFELAEMDLKMRGPGDVFGLRQWGVPDAVFEAASDPKLIRDARNEAAEILKKDPSLKLHPDLKEALKKEAGEIHPE